MKGLLTFHWVLRFNAEGPCGLLNRKAPGRASRLNDDQRAALAKRVEDGPVPAVDGPVRWRLKDLGGWLFETFGISLDETTIGRELKAMGFAKLSARPRHHAQSGSVLVDFKKTSPPVWQRSRADYRPEPT